MADKIRHRPTILAFTLVLPSVGIMQAFLKHLCTILCTIYAWPYSGRMKSALLCLLYISVGSALAQPQVHAPSGVFRGNSSIADLDQFLGIPYAQPPVKGLRFANPLPVDSSQEHAVDATAYGPGCSQLASFAEYNGLGEDCLSLNVIRPCGTSPNAALPVMFWIHGGGNTNGQSIFYNGTALVQHSIAIDHPVVYVGINYRLNGFGFLNSPAIQVSTDG